MNNIHIKHPDKFKEKLDIIKKGNAESLHIISDFDGTLTKFKVNGKMIRSSYGYARDGDYLKNNYKDRSQEMFDYYYPIETDPDISKEEKNKKMEEWWTKHWDLMIECGFDIDIVRTIAKKMQLREGCFEFFDMLKEKHIPLLIFSAGIGNVIQEHLDMHNLVSYNVYLITNLLEFDDDGNSISWNKESMIHTFNKNEAEIKDENYHKEIEKRKNVILLGDALGDVNMAEGINHDCVIKIGFLNEFQDKLLKKYEELFDIVILDEGSFHYINDMIKDIIND